MKVKYTTVSFLLFSLLFCKLNAQENKRLAVNSSIGYGFGFSELGSAVMYKFGLNRMLQNKLYLKYQFSNFSIAKIETINNIDLGLSDYYQMFGLGLGRVIKVHRFDCYADGNLFYTKHNHIKPIGGIDWNDEFIWAEDLIHDFGLNVNFSLYYNLSDKLYTGINCGLYGLPIKLKRYAVSFDLNFGIKL